MNIGENVSTEEWFETPLSLRDLYWLAGLLEGEGSFMKPVPSAPTMPIVSVQMTDRDVVERVAVLFGVKLCEVKLDQRNPAWKRTYKVIARGSRAIRLMRDLHPLMGERRRGQIEAALAARELAMTIRRKIRKVLTPAQRRELSLRLDSGEGAVALAQEYEIARESVYRAAKRGRAA